MITILVITHGHFGDELLRTAQEIAGRQESVAAISVTPEMGTDSVGEALDRCLDRLRSMEGYLILVDMLGGTPCNTALLRTKDKKAEVVTGVNLYMLLSGFTHRDQLEVKALAQKVSEDGKRAIVLAKDLLLKRLA
jgi:PTS system mannose-specific IIA component